MNFLKSLQKILQGQSVILVDVGSAGGIERRWKRLNSCLHTLTFEPDERAFAQLPQSPQIKNFPYALGYQDGETDFFLTAFPPASSVFRPDLNFLSAFPNTTDHTIIGQQRIVLRRLQDILQKNGISEIDFIKLDTQGSDLAILMGGESFLRTSVFGIQIEVEFNPTYLGRPSFGEIDNYIRKYGFSLFHLKREFWKRNQITSPHQTTGQLIWADAIYLRSVPSLLEICSKKEESVRSAFIAKSIVLCLVYEFPDYAMEICRQAQLNKMISSDTAERWIKAICSTGKWHLRLPLRLHPTVLGKAHRFLARLVWSFYKRIQPHWRNFAISDPE